MTSFSPFGTDEHFEPNSRVAGDTEPDRSFDPTANAWHVPFDRTAYSADETVPAGGPSRMEQLNKISLMLCRQDDDEGGETRTRFPIENNQRQFARCAVAEDRTTGVLSMNGRSFNCRLVEMSIGGFGVIVEGRTQFTEGATGKLHAPGMSYIVSVTRQEGRPDGVYVGLKQVSEIVDRKQGFRETSPLLSYCIAAFSGGMIVIISYFMMYGMRG